MVEVTHAMLEGFRRRFREASPATRAKMTATAKESRDGLAIAHDGMNKATAEGDDEALFIWAMLGMAVFTQMRDAGAEHAAKIN